MKKYSGVASFDSEAIVYLTDPVLNVDTLVLKLSILLSDVDYVPTDYEILTKGVSLEVKVKSVNQSLFDDPILVLGEHPVLKNKGWTSPDYPHYFDCDTNLIVDTRTSKMMWDTVKLERAKRLLATDWTQLPDVPLATKEAWSVYRQALRDITEQPDPFNIVWPTPPQ